LVEAVSKTIFGQWACVKLLERGVICQPASHHWNNLKIIPPLTFTHAHSDTLVSAFVEVLSEYKGVASLVKDATGRLGRQMASGWSF
jgi:4-aminobutyrate aminotransferase-like enzyme